MTQTKDERLAAQLRANLKRRKEQARGQEEAGSRIKSGVTEGERI